MEELEIRREAESNAAIRDWQERVDSLQFAEEQKEKERQREAMRKKELRRQEHEMNVKEAHREIV